MNRVKINKEARRRGYLNRTAIRILKKSKSSITENEWRTLGEYVVTCNYSVEPEYIGKLLSEVNPGLLVSSEQSKAAKDELIALVRDTQYMKHTKEVG